MSDKQHDDWDPQEKSVLEDQRLAYDKMREKCPIARSEFLGWSLFHHEDIIKVLAEPEIYSNKSQFLAIPNGMDPPVHEQYRNALAPHFAEEQLTKLEPRARKIAIDLLNSMRVDVEK